MSRSVGVFRRASADDHMLGPQQALSRVDALRGVIQWPAYLCFDDNKRRTLEVGKLTDVLVLDRDDLTGREPDARCTLRIVPPPSSLSGWSDRWCASGGGYRFSLRPHPPRADGEEDQWVRNAEKSDSPSARGGWGLTTARSTFLARHLSLYRHKVDGGVV